MYLAQLNNENKKSFLFLCHCIASSNGVYDESEAVLLDQFQKEMGTSFDLGEIKDSESEDNIEAVLAGVSDIDSQRIFFLELMVLVYANDNYDETQRHIIDTVKSSFGFDDSLMALMEEWARNLNSLNRQGQALIDL